MARASQKDRVLAWQSRVHAANQAYAKWETKFKCSTLLKYYLGEQWQDAEDTAGKEKYVINMFFPTIQVRLPSLLFYHPRIKVDPHPARLDDQASDVEARAALLGDTANTLIRDPKLRFKSETLMAILEAHFRFGVVEVGYTADFVDNPAAGRPMLDDNDEVLMDAHDNPIPQPDRILNPVNPTPERLFVKRIPARNFRVPVDPKNQTNWNDWLGYWEWQRISDVKANTHYANRTNLKRSGTLSKDYGRSDLQTPADVSQMKDMIKLWKTWDLRTKKRYVFADGADTFLLDGEPFAVQPFAALRFYEIPDEWYPFPPSYSWVHPQNELNETRQQQRIHRRRFNRRYTLREGGLVSDDEIAKLADADSDGVIVRATMDNPVMPIIDAPLDAAVVRNIPLTKDDFREISGVTAEDRGVADTETATQANILDIRSRIRESFARVEVAEFLGDIARIMLETVIDKMVLPLWVKMNTDPLGVNAAAEAGVVRNVWQQIKSEELGDIASYDISVDVDSLSPLTEADKRTAWNQVLALLTNPGLVTVLMGSEVLLRKTLAFYDIKSEREIEEIKKAGEQIVMLLQHQAQGQSGVGLPQAPGPAATPTQAQIAGQIQAQLPGVQ